MQTLRLMSTYFDDLTSYVTSANLLQRLSEPESQSMSLQPLAAVLRRSSLMEPCKSRATPRLPHSEWKLSGPCLVFWLPSDWLLLVRLTTSASGRNHIFLKRVLRMFWKQLIHSAAVSFLFGSSINLPLQSTALHAWKN